MPATVKPKPSPSLILTTVLSSSLTIVFSIIYIVLCMLALIYRYDCTAGALENGVGSSYLLRTVYRVYIQDGTCDNALTVAEITSDYSVMVLSAITLSASFVCLVVAIALLTVVIVYPDNQYLSLYGYGYVGLCIAAFAVDLTFALHFGIDHSYLSQLLNASSPGMEFNYERDMIRIGAFLLMTITLKGFIGHAINIVLLSMMVVYLMEFSTAQREYEHSIHKLGVIKAYDSKRKSNVTRCVSCQASIANGSAQQNFGFVNDERPRSFAPDNSRRDRDDASTASFDRPFNWQQAPPSAARPFSYLEDNRRSTRQSPSPAPEPLWQRGPWNPPPPPVPAPDYSPHAPRRLKSALKSGYM